MFWNPRQRRKLLELSLLSPKMTVECYFIFTFVYRKDYAIYKLVFTTYNMPNETIIIIVNWRQ